MTRVILAEDDFAQDVVRDFLQEVCESIHSVPTERVNEIQVRSRDLYTVFGHWCIAHYGKRPTHAPQTINGFSRVLKSQRWTVRTTTAGRTWVDIGLHRAGREVLADLECGRYSTALAKLATLIRENGHEPYETAETAPSHGHEHIERSDPDPDPTV